MSFYSAPVKGKGWNAGYFLANDETCLRQSMTIAADHAQVQTRGERRVVPAGAVIPANNSDAAGILFEDIDVTEGAAPGSVVIGGVVYADRLPAAIDDNAASAMTGITIIEEAPAVVRPDYFNKEFVNLTVTSAEGATSGKTVISVSGVTLGIAEQLQYKVDADPLPLGFVATGAIGYNDFASGDSLTIADGKKVAVIAVTAGGYVFGAGTVTADTKA